MHNHNRVSFLIPRIIIVAILVIFFPLQSMNNDTKLSKDRQAWLLDVTTKIPDQLKTMNEGVEDSAKTLFRALATNKFSRMNIPELISNLESSAKTAHEIYSNINIMSHDTQATLNSIASRTNKHSTRAQWFVTNLPEKKSEQEFWNSSSEITEEHWDPREELQKKQIEEKEHRLKILKDSNLVWQRKNDKKSDKNEKEDEKKPSQKSDNSNEEYQKSFLLVLQNYNHALKNAAFNVKLWQDMPKNTDALKHALKFLYQAQGIKNNLFSIPAFQHAKSEKSFLYEHCSDFYGLKKNLYTIHNGLADTSKKHEGLKVPLATRDWIILACGLAKGVVNNPATIHELLKLDSFENLLQGEVMKRLKDSWIHSVLVKGSGWVHFFDNHQKLKSLITPFGRYLVRPVLKGAISLTKYALKKDKTNELPTMSLQDNLDAYLLDIRDTYARIKKENETVPATKHATYCAQSLKTVYGDVPNIKCIPLTVEQAQRQKRDNKRRIEDIELQLKANKEQLKKLEACKQDDAYLHYKLNLDFENNALKKCIEKKQRKVSQANFWLNYHQGKVEKEDYAITPLEVARERYDALKNQKEVLEETAHDTKKESHKSSRATFWHGGSVHFMQAKRKLEKKELETKREAESRKKESESLKLKRAREDLDQSLVYYSPEDLLFPNAEESTAAIRLFIEQQAEQCRSIIDNYHDFMLNCDISLPQLLSLQIKASLNKEYEPLKQTLDNYEQERNTAWEEKETLEKDQRAYQQKSEETIKGFFSKRAHSATSFLWGFYSMVKTMYLEWKMTRNQRDLKKVDEKINFIVDKNIKELKKRFIFQAYQQMYKKKTHQPYVKEQVLKEKIHVLATFVDPLFWFALPPEERHLKTEIQKKSPFIEHQKPQLKHPFTVQSTSLPNLPQQTGLECGYYACLFAKRLLEGLPITRDENFEAQLLEYKEKIEIKRMVEDQERQEEGLSPLERSAMLETSEVSYLLKSGNVEDHILCIPSVYDIINNNVIDIPTIQHLDYIQKTNGKHFIVLSTTGNGHTDGHYIALCVDNNNHHLSCSVANSLKGYNCNKVIEDFMIFLSSDDFQKVVQEKDSDEVRECLGVLDFVQVFNQRKYHLTDTKNAIKDNNVPRDVMENERTLESLVDLIIEKSFHLYGLTNGEALWTESGFRDTRAVILDAIRSLENANEQSIVVYPTMAEHSIHLNNEQKECIEQLKNKLLGL